MEERRIEAGEGGSREIVSKNNFIGFYSRAFHREVRVTGQWQRSAIGSE